MTSAVATIAFGCGASDIGPRDASANSIIEAGVESARDASQDVVATDGQGEPDAEVPVSCDAGDYYVTVNDGTSTRVLRGGCRDAGLDVPWVQMRSLGDNCVSPFLHGCSSTLGLTSVIGPCSGLLAVGTQPALVTYDDRSGRTLTGSGKEQLTSVSPLGGTVAGRYAANLGVDGGADAGSVSGTFCVLYIPSQ